MSADLIPQPPLPLSLWQKRQATLLYHWMSLDYLEELKRMVDRLIDGADVLLDLSRRQQRDALVSSARWGVRDTSANWSTYAHPALADFRESTIRLIAWRANEVFCGTGAYQCAHMLDETSSRWMTEDEEQHFKTQFGAVFAHASRIDAVTDKNLSDSCMAAYWLDYASDFPRLPRLQVRTDVVAETGRRPPRTGVYVPQDDPYGTLQFAWTGNDRGALSAARTFNAAGLEAVHALGRHALWHDEARMMAYVIEALKQRRLQPENGIDWQGVDDLIAARLVLGPQVFIERPCKWHFVEMIHGEYDDAPDDTPAAPPAHRNNVPAGQPCPQAGWWFSPADTLPRRNFQHGEIMPELGSRYGHTFWQWAHDQGPAHT